MTLDTRIFVLDPVDPKEVFQFCQGLLGRPLDQQRWEDAQWLSYSYRVLSNHPGQGMPAWLMLYYRPGAPLFTAEQAAEHAEDCNIPENPDYYQPYGDLCDGNHYARRACWLKISFDTGYGYKDDQGYGCGDLHAEYISRIGLWLDEKGVRWEWMNEFTSEIHGGADRYKKLIDLASGGFQASAWFKSTVLPALGGALPQLEK